MTGALRLLSDHGHVPEPWRDLYPAVGWTRCTVCHAWISVTDGDTNEDGALVTCPGAHA